MIETDHENPLLSYYRRYVGDPERTVDVYAGFGLFFAGIALGAVGVAVFVWSGRLPPNELSTYAVRQVAAVASAIGLPALLFGVVVLLPVDRRMLYLASGGGLICIGAVGLFVWAYPHHWNVVNPPDYSVQGVAVYSVGLVMVIASTGAALVAHRVEQVSDRDAGSTADGDGREEETTTDEQVRADIDRELEAAELSWGGVERKETRRLELDTSDVDDVDYELPESAATSRTSDGSVDDAVAQLRGLQGGNVETASGGGTDEQTTALQELRKQQEESDTNSRSIIDRIRRVF